MKKIVMLYGLLLHVACSADSGTVNFSLAIADLSNAVSFVQGAGVPTGSCAQLTQSIANLYVQIPTQTQSSGASVNEQVATSTAITNALATIVNNTPQSTGAVDTESQTIVSITSTVDLIASGTATSQQLTSSASSLQTVANSISTILSFPNAQISQSAFVNIASGAGSIVQSASTILANSSADPAVSVAAASMIESWMNMMSSLVYALINEFFYTPGGGALYSTVQSLGTMLHNFASNISPAAFNLGDEAIIIPLVNAYAAIFGAYEFLVRSWMISDHQLFSDLVLVGASLNALTASDLFANNATIDDINAVSSMLFNQLNNSFLGYVQLFSVSVSDDSDIAAYAALSALQNEATIANAQAAAAAFALYTASVNTVVNG